MHPQLSLALAEARQQEFLDSAKRERRFRRAKSDSFPPETLFEGLTLRLATHADSPALARLAELEQAQRPAEPLLLGVVMSRPVVALSLSDGRVIADPFFGTTELIELLRVRARQLARRNRGGR
jgi:hypothetical protein